MLYNLSDAELDELSRINIACSALSFTGSSLILITYLSYRQLQKFSFRLVFWLSFSDVCLSVCYFLGRPEGKTVRCYIQAYLSQFFNLASFLWTSVIAFALHRTVVQHREDTVNMHNRFHLFVWAVSLVFSLLPTIKDSYAAGFGPWCWITGQTVFGRVLRFLVFYIPLWICIFYNAVTYFKVIRLVRRTQRLADYSSRRGVHLGEKAAQVSNSANKAVARLGNYPLILIVCWFFGSINVIQTNVSPSSPQMWLFRTHVALSSLNGLFNAITYGLNASVRIAICGSFEARILRPLRLVSPARRLNQFQDLSRQGVDTFEDDGDPEMDESISTELEMGVRLNAQSGFSSSGGPVGVREGEDEEVLITAAREGQEYEEASANEALTFQGASLPSEEVPATVPRSS